MCRMVLTRPVAGFLLGSGAFQWLIWPNFLRNIWTDERAFDDGPTSFLLVHAALTVASLAIGTGLLVIGARAWRRASSAAERGRDNP